MRLYITRHGETEWNKEGRMQGWKDSKLTEAGIDNAKKLGLSLKHIDFDCIYASPIGRAVETAKYIRGDKSTRIVLHEGLKEIGLGAWEGMEHSRIEELYPIQRYNFWNKPHLYEPVEGESFDELLERVKNTLEHIIDNPAGEDVLIVTHAVVKKAIYSIIRGSSLKNLWDPPMMYDTCLTVIEITGNEKRFILEGDISHLDR